MKALALVFIMLFCVLSAICSAEVTVHEITTQPIGTHKRLNNLVIELLNVPVATRESYVFQNPRKGWVFTAVGGKEAMRLLPPGRQTITAQLGKPVIVRAIPEIVYTGLGYRPSPFLKGYPRYDWKQLQAWGIPQNINVILERKPEPGFDPVAWRASGKLLRVRGGTHGLDHTKAYEAWSGHRGFAPDRDGIMLSEINGYKSEKNRTMYELWTKALERLAKTHPNHQFVPYGNAMYQSEFAIEFLRTLKKYGHLYTEERYIMEQPTYKATRGELYWLGWIIQYYRDKIPGIERNLLIALGHMSAPPETLDVLPDVDYKVFLDMQFRYIANEPAFKDLYGIMCYHAAYADEEIVRWSAKLFRHYCIEGKRGLLSRTRLRSPIVKNGDFEFGADSWALSKAERGSIGSMFVRSYKGYSYLQGRYPRTEHGDTFLWTKRNATRPNVARQMIHHLRPGKAYSLKLIVADYQDMKNGTDRKQTHDLDIQLRGVSWLAEKSFHETMRSGRAGHTGGPFTRENNLWITHYRLVFRAAAESADCGSHPPCKCACTRLAISDWKDGKPNGAIGQELAINFVSIQPYLEE